VFILIRKAAALAAMRPTLLQTGVECCAAEAELVLVRLRWRTHEGEVVLSLPMSLEKKKAKEFAVHACGGACDGGQERDAVIVSV
jgi:CelD/BcsL family acetyltransferase involved in cellulose biosynthesis